MTDLDAARLLQRLARHGATFAGARSAQVLERRHPAVAAEVDIETVEAGLVAAAQEIGAPLQRLVGHEWDRVGQTDGAGEADVGAGRGLDLILGRETHGQRIDGVGELDLVDLEIAAHHHGDDLGLVLPSDVVEDGLGHAAGLPTGEERCKLRHGLHVGRGELLHGTRLAASGCVG